MLNNNCEQQVIVYANEPKGTNPPDCDDNFLKLKQTGEKYLGFSGKRLCRKPYTRKQRINEPQNWFSSRKTSEHLVKDFNYDIMRHSTDLNKIILLISLKKEICCGEGLCKTNTQFPFVFSKRDFASFISSLYELLDNEYVLQKNIIKQLSTLFDESDTTPLLFSNELKNDLYAYRESLLNSNEGDDSMAIINYIKDLIKNITIGQLLISRRSIIYKKSSFINFKYLFYENLPINITISANGEVVESTQKRKIKIYSKDIDEIGFEAIVDTKIAKMGTDEQYKNILVSEFFTNQNRKLYAITFLSNFINFKNTSGETRCGFSNVKQKIEAYSYNNTQGLSYVLITEQMLKMFIVLAKVFSKKICFIPNGQLESELS